MSEPVHGEEKTTGQIERDRTDSRLSILVRIGDQTADRQVMNITFSFPDAEC